MASSDPLAGLPAAGAFPILLSDSFKAAAKGKKASKDEAFGLRCKPTRDLRDKQDLKAYIDA